MEAKKKQTEMQALFSAIITSSALIMVIFIVLYFILIQQSDDKEGIALFFLFSGVCSGVVTLIFNYNRP